MKITLSICFMSLILMSCGTSKITQSNWHDEDYKKSITGKLKFDPSSGFLYSISNDDENIYINLRITDRIVQRKILMMGMTVWIDTLGKKQENLGISFPVGMRSMMTNASRPQQTQRPSREDYRNRLAAGAQRIKLIGFEGAEEIQNTNEALPGLLSGEISRDKMDIMNYALVIPFERIPDLKNKNGFSIGIKTGYLDLTDMSAMRERMAQRGGRPGGGGAHPTGRRPGGAAGRQFSPEDMEAMTMPSELWIKNIQIAEKQ